MPNIQEVLLLNGKAIGAFPSSGGGIRYDEENDVVQLFYDGQWRDWKSGGMAYPVGSEVTFPYTGNIVPFTVPASGIWRLEVWGAQGGSANQGIGGKGGYSVGDATLESDDIIYVCVGGTPTSGSADGGYNGGGTVATVASNRASAGGGATHIAKRTGVLSELNSYRDDIIIVAGGGGGGGGGTQSFSGQNSYGGAGGGTNGTAGGSLTDSGGYTAYGGGAGGQSSGGTGGGCNQAAIDRGYNTTGASGSFGQGASSTSANQTGSGGGGGYYGGGMGGSVIQTIDGAGGGGSGYINNTVLSNYSMNSGIREGHGYAKLTYLGIAV